MISDVERVRRRQGRWVPAVAEAENAFVYGHHVDHDAVAAPPTHRRTGRRVLAKSQCAQALAERGVAGVGRDIADRVDVHGGTNTGGRWVGDEEARRAAADEHEIVEHWPEQPHDRLEEYAIRVSHEAGSGGAR